MTNQKKRVLIAEDDKFISEMYFTKISQEGFDVVLAGDGKAALEEISKQEPDLMLLDILMPKMSGLEVLQELGKQKKIDKFPIIVLTNANEKENIEKVFELGVKNYLIKSNFTPEEIMSKIKEIINI